MKIVFTGEMDHGKSSLIGRLLMDTGSLPKDKVREFKRIAGELGEGACLAYLVDQLAEEREGGLTIDADESYIEHKGRSFACIDTPGHAAFLKNMVTGACRADAAVLLIDAAGGMQPQTKKHLDILKLLGITAVIAVINKMDLCGYEEGRFRAIEENLRASAPAAVIPISAWEGTNTARPGRKTPWYKGPCLLEAMAALPAQPPPAHQALRLPVQDIYTVGDKSLIVGRIASGMVRKGQKALVCPSMEEMRIEAVKIFGRNPSSAGRWENVGLTFSGRPQVKRGFVLCDPADALRGTQRFQTRLLWMDKPSLKKDERLTMRVSTQTSSCTVDGIEGSDELGLGGSGEVFFSTTDALIVQSFQLEPELGRFTVERGNKPAGLGLITKVLAGVVIALVCLLRLPGKACADPPASSSFLKVLAEGNEKSRWRPLKIQTRDQTQAGENLGDLRALSYLQGYAPAPSFKNVTIYDRTRAFHGDNLFVSAHAAQAVLMDMNGNVLHTWHYSCRQLPGVDPQFCPEYWTKARILENGGLVAMVPFVGLLKLDKDSRLLWFVRLLCHHDFDIDENGNIYTLTIKESPEKDKPLMKSNSIVMLSAQGKTLKEISLHGLFKAYPEKKYFDQIEEFGRGQKFFNTTHGNKVSVHVPGDAFHANSIQVLDGRNTASPAFKNGNLLVNLRNIGVLIAVDPVQEKIVWLMDARLWDNGQHFAKMLGNGNILLFDNFFGPGLSRVVEFDPSTKKIVWSYTDRRKRFFSSFLGECYRLPNGNTLITESTAGRSFEVTPDKNIVWEFYNPNRTGKNNGLIALTYQMQRVPQERLFQGRNNGPPSK